MGVFVIAERANERVRKLGKGCKDALNRVADRMGVFL